VWLERLQAPAASAMDGQFILELPEVKWRGPGDAHRGGGHLVPKEGGGLAWLRQNRPHMAAVGAKSGERLRRLDGVSGVGNWGKVRGGCGEKGRASMGPF
jgi:hypothetical protein